METYSLKDAFKTMSEVDDSKIADLIEDIKKKAPKALKESIAADATKKIPLREGFVGQTLSDFLDVCDNEDRLERITISNIDEDDYDKSLLLKDGRPEDITNSELKAEFEDFDCGGKAVIVSIDSAKSESEDPYFETLSDFIDNYNGDDVVIEDFKDGQEVFRGDKEDIPDEFLESTFLNFKCEEPGYLSVNVSLKDSNDEDEDDEDAEDDSMDESKEMKESTVSESSSFDKLKKAVETLPDYSAADLDKEESEEEEINKSLPSLDDAHKVAVKEKMSEELKHTSINLGDSDAIKGAKDELEKEETREPIEKVVDVDAEVDSDLKGSYIGSVILRCPTCKTLIYKRPEELEKQEDQEDIKAEDVIYNVGEECPHCGSKDGFKLVGQVATLDTPVKDEDDTPTAGFSGSEIEEPKEEAGGFADKAAKLSSETEESGEEPKKEKAEAEAPKDESLIGIIRGFDDESFDKAVTKYLVEIYENVASYKTIEGSITDNNKLLLEGVINYKSGKTHKTEFVFERLPFKTKAGLRFSGLNESFTKEGKCFTLDVKMKDGCLITESFGYDYIIEDNNLNESKQISGRIFNK